MALGGTREGEGEGETNQSDVEVISAGFSDEVEDELVRDEWGGKVADDGERQGDGQHEHEKAFAGSPQVVGPTMTDSNGSHPWYKMQMDIKKLKPC